MRAPVAYVTSQHVMATSFLVIQAVTLKSAVIHWWPFPNLSAILLSRHYQHSRNEQCSYQGASLASLLTPSSSDCYTRNP